MRFVNCNLIIIFCAILSGLTGANDKCEAEGSVDNIIILMAAEDGALQMDQMMANSDTLPENTLNGR